MRKCVRKEINLLKNKGKNENDIKSKIANIFFIIKYLNNIK